MTFKIILNIKNPPDPAIIGSSGEWVLLFITNADTSSLSTVSAFVLLAFYSVSLLSVRVTFMGAPNIQV